MAINNIEPSDYKNLTPFKEWLVNQINTWGINNFPFLEGDFDKLTNYGMMMKLMKALNEVITNENLVEQDMKSLFDAFTELQSYINNYFTNLDVQEEINNKLDEMAENGSLTLLIKNYVDPIYQSYQTSINNELDSFQTQINNIASGSPLVASSTADMTDTTRIYVNTQNGHWYYYNGSAWTDGGTYQATEIQDGSIYYSKLDEVIKNMYNTNGKSSIVNVTYTEGGYYNTNLIDLSNASELASYGYADVNVSEGEIYYIYGYNWNAQHKLWALTDSNNQKISTSSITLNTTNIEEIIIPHGATKLKINALLTLMPTLTKVESVDLSSDIYDEIDNHIETLTKNYDAINITGLTTAFSYSGLPTRYCNWINSLFDSENTINENDVLEFECDIFSEDMTNLSAFYFLIKQSTNVYQVNVVTNTSYLDNKPCIKKITDNIYHVKMRFKAPILNTDRSLIFSPAENNSNSNASYTLFNINLTNVTEEEIIDIYSNIIVNSTNQVKTKFSYALGSNDLNNYRGLSFGKWYAIGDSITEVNFRALHNYIYYTLQDLKTVTAVNLGLSGSGYIARANTNQAYVNRLSQIQNYDVENDIITVAGGVNDWNQSKESIQTAVRNFFTTLFNTYPGARVGLITPTSSTTNYVIGERNFCEALIEVAEEFSVPVLDLNKCDNLRPEMESVRNTYFKADGIGSNNEVDGLHPNSLGHFIFHNEVKEFIKKL